MWRSRHCAFSLFPQRLVSRLDSSIVLVPALMFILSSAFHCWLPRTFLCYIWRCDGHAIAPSRCSLNASWYLDLIQVSFSFSLSPLYYHQLSIARNQERFYATIILNNYQECPSLYKHFLSNTEGMTHNKQTLQRATTSASMISSSMNEYRG